MASLRSLFRMPKKGKKVAGKAEEKQLLQLQHRAQAEQEMSRKKEETLALFLRDKLQREQRNMAVNEQKVKDGWQFTLAQTKHAELRGHVEVAQQMFERQLDEQNAIIQKLVGELEGAELQMEKVQRSHLQHMEHLCGQQDRRLRDLQEQWDRGLQDLSSTNSCEMNQMLAQFQQRYGKLSDCILIVEHNSSNMEEKVQRQLEENQAWLEALAFCKSTDGVECTYHKEDITRYKLAQQRSLQESQKLSEQISKDQQQTSKDLRNIKRLQHQAIQLKRQMFLSAAENLLKEQDLMDQRDLMNFRCLQLQDHLGQGRGAARKQLTQLVVQGDAAAKKLQAVIAKGERVLRLGEMCRKLELRVGLLSSPSSSSSSEELQQLQDRLNTALLHRKALRASRKDLVQENQQLQLTIGSDSCFAATAASLTPTASDPVPSGRAIIVTNVAHVARSSQ